MTRPVQIAFIYEHVTPKVFKPKVFLRTLLYATGKRGYVIEGLYLKIQHGDSAHTFGFWGYGEHKELMAAGGLRVTDEGVAFNHHFLQSNEKDHFYFSEGEYEVKVYARVVYRRSARLLCTVKLTLPEDQATRMYLKTSGVLFTWDPDAQTYRPTLSPEK